MLRYDVAPAMASHLSILFKLRRLVLQEHVLPLCHLSRPADVLKGYNEHVRRYGVRLRKIHGILMTHCMPTVCLKIPDMRDLDLVSARFWLAGLATPGVTSLFPPPYLLQNGVIV
jgi:hypothetical protein